MHNVSDNGSLKRERFGGKAERMIKNTSQERPEN